MGLALSYLTLAGGLLFAAGLLSIALRLIRADKIEGKKSAVRTPKILDALLGRARTRDDWIPDARVQAGMVYNKRKGRLEISGRLSRDTFDRVFR